MLFFEEYPQHDCAVRGQRIRSVYQHFSQFTFSCVSFLNLVRFFVCVFNSVLPKFSVKLSVPPYILETDEHFKVTITARLDSRGDAMLQERIVDIAHEGHLDMVKTKALLREKVWFPCMDKMVETKVKACLPCQVVTPVYTREPLQMSVLPDSPFDEVNVDFAHVDGQTLLLMVDDYSRFPFGEPVSSTSASAVISKLDQLFSTFGAPRVVKSDNGPPFNGEEFTKFACVLGFKHRKVTPVWARANGEVEIFVKTLKKCIKAAKVEGRNWRK